MELPSHPEANESPSREQRAPKTSWAAVVFIGLVGALVVLIVVLHLTGAVGPSGH